MDSQPNFSQAKRVATQIIERYGFTHPKEIDLEDIAWASGIEVKDTTLSSSEAQLVRLGSVGIIRLSQRGNNVRRRRFSIGHELGHWELHKGENQLWVCTADNIHRYKGSPLEIEANAFSSELLMPTSMFRPMCRRGPFGFAIADILSDTFNASLTATALRLAEETSEPAVVVLSDGERVLWSRRNIKKLPDFCYHIPPGSRVSDETLSWGASIDGDGCGDVKPRSWFPNLKEPWRHTVHEEVRHFENFHLTLALLTVYEE